MAAVFRSQATGRFYKAFHSWSKLANAHQRRCLISTNSVSDANDAPSVRLNYKQHDRRKLQVSTKDAPKTESPSHKPSVGHLKIPQERLSRILENRDFLNALYAAYGVTLKPQDPTPHDIQHGLRDVRITTPGRFAWTRVKKILVQEDILNRYLTQPSLLAIKIVHSLHHMPNRVFELLLENSSELKLKIEETFSVQIKVMPTKDDRMPSVSFIGEHDATQNARAFIKSISIPDDEPALIQSSPAELEYAYKTAMRCVPSSVVVLTTHHGSPHDHITLESVRGMTVSSMTSVTLQPEPIVSFSIRGPSRTLDCITQGQPFYVNFLNNDLKGAQIADHFSKPHEDPSQPFHTVEETKLASISPHTNTLGPVLTGKSIPILFKCELLPGKSLEIGDHTVVFARVVNIWTSEKFREGVSTVLAYAQGQYRKLANQFLDVNKPNRPNPTEMNESASAVPESSATQSEQQQPEPQKTQVPKGPTTAELAEKEIAQEFNDKYWDMAMADGEEGNDILEERAADQRSVGDAEKP